MTATTALAGGALAWAGIVERRWYAQRHVTVPTLRPAAAAPLRVLHASDLHLQPRRAHLTRFVDRLRLAAPDVVVVTGDVLDHPAVGIEDAVDLLARLRGGRPGVLVLGSHDRYEPQLRNPLEYLIRPERRHIERTYDTDRFVQRLRDTGWVVLCNDRAVLQTRAGLIDITGLDDPHINRDRLDVIAAAPPDAGEVALRLGVVHAPYRRVLSRFDACGFDLVLAGHTHGGQLRVPLLGALVANCDLPLSQVRGLSRYRGTWLHVSAGLGTTRYAPVRFACRPEATVLDVVAAPRTAPSLD